jgi:thioredoxin 1
VIGYRPRADVSAATGLLAAGLLLSACGGGGGSPTATSAPPPAPGPSAVVVLHAGNFDELVLQADGVCLVDFYAPGCTYCTQMEPIVERLAVDFDDRALVGKVNVQDEAALRAAWGIRGWPTFVLFKDGSEVNRWLGATSYEQLAGMIQAALDAP